MRSTLPQRCPVAVVYVTWAAYVVGLAVTLLTGRYALLIAWAVVYPLALWVYVRVFPRISSALGYGSVEDQQAATVEAQPAATRVVLYTGLGCPFCPIVESRLKALQGRMGFELSVVDVTARPDIAARERIRGLPVVVVGQRRRAGCATTDELAALIAGVPAPVGAGVG